MNQNEIRKNENKGFSLVELIVVIAIMAVMTVVLAPTLISYVERSRAQKDDSAMGEVSNAIMLALSDEKIYDEVLSYSCYGNVSCYIDKASESGLTKVTTKAATGGHKEQYMFDENARLADEVRYRFAGNMRGVTITFHPDAAGSNKVVFNLKDAKINEAIKADDPAEKTTDRAADTVAYLFSPAPDYSAKGTLGTMHSASSENCYLYNRVRQLIGDTVTLSSQTYRNSDYTVFIRMGSTGGNQATAQDAVKVYGQWNGTNLVAETPVVPTT